MGIIAGLKIVLIYAQFSLFTFYPPETGDSGGVIREL